MLQKLLLTGGLLLATLLPASAQQSVARRWNEALLQAIREDFARPPVHARNLFHTSMALYDAWAAYDTVAETYLLGKTVGNYSCTFEGMPTPANIKAAQEEAMSYAAYRVLYHRFSGSPNVFTTLNRFNNLMLSLGYDISITTTNYQTGSPAALGNYIAQCVLQMSTQDGANEQNNYAIKYYESVNPPLVMANPGNPTLLDPNRWQKLTLSSAIDQSGNPIPATQVFQSPEWGNVQPFAMTSADLTTYQRDGHIYKVYHDPGNFPQLDTANGGYLSDEYKWNFALVTAWQSHHDPNDGVMWDISPRSIGNVQSYPQTIAEYHDFYDFVNGSDPGIGRDTNPRTGLPYAPQVVPRGDYTRVLAQFWADGPNSETPPGHWFAILNYVSDHPDFVKKFNGKGPVLDPLEWDVKAYFALGGAVHDAAVSAWGIKGWYDGIRPVSALRWMAGLGQSTDPGLPSYNPDGIPLMPGFIELVQAGDPLAGPANQHVGKIKFYTWRGPDYVTDPFNQIAGVGWILAENWWPYQRNTFVTPPFAGYISGHSTYSRSAAEALTLLTGDEYFPGGLGEFSIAANSNFLGLEKGPSVNITLQWATYRDASDQTSLSRIWGGIHPPMDDIPGRLIGAEVGTDAFQLAKTYFYKDIDGDTYYSYEDCNDADATVYPGAPELCDGVDNDCNGLTDDIPVYTYFADVDGDGYGNSNISLDTCLVDVPLGFAGNDQDCDDSNAAIFPGATELCDNIDNDCNGMADDMPIFTYFADGDGDGYGNNAAALDTCLSEVPVGFAGNDLDCDDSNAAIFPGATELCDGIDNDCNGMADDLPFFTYFADNDGDGYGNNTDALDTCLTDTPAGYATNDLDCDDGDAAIFPGATELCDGIDNDCNGMADDLPFFTYFADADNDGYGSSADALDTCLTNTPAGYATNDLDCDDSNAAINPDAQEIIDSLDNNCDGKIDDVVSTHTPVTASIRAFPNPVSEWLTLQSTVYSTVLCRVINPAGQALSSEVLHFQARQARIDCSGLAPGIYFLQLEEVESGRKSMLRFVRAGN